MASIKSRFQSLAIRLLFKRYASTASGIHRRLKWARRWQNCNPPGRFKTDFEISKTAYGGHTLFEMKPRGTEPDLTIIYLHGGGYLFEISRIHWNFIADLAGRANARFVVPIYPLAPEHNWRDVFDFIMPAYRQAFRIAAGTPVVLMGDSAGGGLAAVVVLAARNEGLPQADQLVLLSPWLDLGLTNRSIADVEPDDPWLGVQGSREAARLYADGHDLQDPRLSPIHGDLADLPPTRILVGTRDILAPDCISFTEIADACGCDIELVIGPDMFHVWMLFDSPEGQEARQTILTGLPGHNG
jgi:acetyl esterase/lipase